MQYRDDQGIMAYASRMWCGALLRSRHQAGLWCAMMIAASLVAPRAEAMQKRRSDDLTVPQPQYRFGDPALPGTAAEAAAELPVRMRMSTQLADNLALLFEKFDDSEFIVCLEGEATADGEVRLSDFRMPHMAYSRATSAGMHPDGTCNQYESIVGTLHTHPISHRDDPESGNCYLSRTDIVSWLEYSEYPYTAVMCGPRVWAWWHRSQVDLAKVLAFPPAHQITGAEDIKQSEQ